MEAPGLSAPRTVRHRGTAVRSRTGRRRPSPLARKAPRCRDTTPAGSPSYAADMDKRATHTPTGTVDAHPAVSVEMRNRAQRTSIDGAGQHDTTDLSKVLQAIAARIDVVLDEKVAAGAEPEGRRRAARAWSSVVGKRTAEDTSELRRHALAPTVLRISADGRLDVDDREGDDRERVDRRREVSEVVSKTK